MTNREWLLNKMQNMSDEELIKINLWDFICNAIRSSDCKNGICVDCKLDWLKAEHKEKITLSEAERVILENIDKEYKWIARDNVGYIYIYSIKPAKGKSLWYNGGKFISIEAFNHLFQFITWNDSEPYNIEELLKEKKTY